MKDDLLVKGSTIMSFCNLCMSIEYIAGAELLTELEKVKDPDGWYKFEILTEIFSLVEENYENPGNIFEVIGEETIKIWYRSGGGKKKISKGVDFLKFQTGSEGYQSMVKGPRDKVGEFFLKSLDEENGRAVLVDTSPFNPYFVKGILYGGMKAVGDLMSVNIDYLPSNKNFLVMFR